MLRSKLQRDPRGHAWHSSLMTAAEISALLEKLRAGEVRPDAVLRALQAAPVVELGFANVDTHRSLRKGFPEVIYAAGKTPAQVAAIARELARREKCFLVTRATSGHARAVIRKVRGSRYHDIARCITFERPPLPKRPGTIAIVAAGTSDLPVAEEAAVTAEVMGNTVARI